MKEEQSRFNDLQENILDNFYTIKAIIEECISDGMLDPDFEQYNHIIELIDETKAAQNENELDMIMTLGKDIEKILDSWLAREGRNSIGISWPKI